MMASEVAELLGRIAAYDRRTLGEADVLAWHEVLRDIAYDDALAAVVEHFKISREWLMPVDVRMGAKRLRGTRLGVVETVPDADPDDVPAYLSALREQRVRVATGALTDRDMRAIERVFRGAEA